MPVTITRTQRDAIHEAMMDHRRGISDVRLAENGDLTKARQLGQTSADDLPLLKDLG